MANEILVVDDNLDIRVLISGILKDKGFIVREAANFDQALTEIKKKLPDVAIIDVKLDKGDNDGIELLTYIKKTDDDVPVIMISGHANVQMAVDSLKLGAFEFMQKPFSAERLLNFVNRAIENINLKKEKRILESKLFHSYDIIGESNSIETSQSGILMPRVTSPGLRAFTRCPEAGNIIVSAPGQYRRAIRFASSKALGKTYLNNSSVLHPIRIKGLSNGLFFNSHNCVDE